MNKLNESAFQELCADVFDEVIGFQLKNQAHFSKKIYTKIVAQKTSYNSCIYVSLEFFQVYELQRNLSNCQVDRRELETIWVASVSGRTLPVELRESHAPHLSIHPNFSIFRNQGRQKMATFRNRGFFVLVYYLTKCLLTTILFMNGASNKLKLT